jgi:hypothetical protein
MGRLLALALLALSTVLLAPAPAFACSCAALSPAEYVDGTDVIVSGRVLDHQDARSRPWGGSPSTYLVATDSVWRGEVTERFEVVGGGPNDPCGMEGIEVDRRYVFFLHRQGDELHGSLCGGTGSVSERQVDRLLDPVAGQPTRGGPTRVGGSLLAGGDLAAVGGGALAAALGVVAWRVRRARRG